MKCGETNEKHLYKNSRCLTEVDIGFMLQEISCDPSTSNLVLL